jgi:hypothetical protein
MATDFSGIQEGLNKVYDTNQKTGSRFSGLSKALDDLIAAHKAQQDAQNTQDSSTQLLGVQGLMSGKLQPAQADDKSSFGIKGLNDGSGKPIRLSQKDQMTAVYNPETGQVEYSVPKGSKFKPIKSGALSNSDLEAAAQLLASGKEVPSQISGFSKQRQQIIDRAIEINPDFDPKQAELAFKASGSMMVDSKVQDTKVNQANNLMTIFNKGYDPKTDTYTISPSQHYELALGYAKMVSPTGVVAQQTADELRQRTAKEGLAGAAIFLGVDPKVAGGPPQSLIKFFRDNIDNQAKDAVATRGNYSQGNLTDYIGINGSGYKSIRAGQQTDNDPLGLR